MNQKIQDIKKILLGKWEIILSYFKGKKKIPDIKETLMEKRDVILSFFKSKKQRIIKKKKKKSKLRILLEKIFTLLNVSATIGLIISVIGLFYFGLATKTYLDAQEMQTNGIKKQIKLNLSIATNTVLEILNREILYKKNIRQITQDLNEKDENGRIYVFSPCNRITPAFGEYPDAGNIIITKPNVITVEIIAHDCNAQPFEKKIINLAPIPRNKNKPETSAHKSNNDNHKDTKSTEHNVHEDTKSTEHNVHEDTKSTEHNVHEDTKSTEHNVHEDTKSTEHNVHEDTKSTEHNVHEDTKSTEHNVYEDTKSSEHNVHEDTKSTEHNVHEDTKSTNHH